MPIKKPRRKHSVEGLVELLKAANGGTLPSENLREFREKGAEKVILVESHVCPKRLYRTSHLRGNAKGCILSTNGKRKPLRK